MDPDEVEFFNNLNASLNNKNEELSMWLDEEKLATALQFKEINELKELLNALASALENAEDVLRIIYHCSEGKTRIDSNTCAEKVREALATYESWRNK